MKKEMIEVAVSVIAASIASVIAEAMPNLVLRILFILGVWLTQVLFLMRQEIRWQWKDIAIGVVGTITLILFFVSIVINGSDFFLQQLQGFIAVEAMNENTEEIDKNTNQEIEETKLDVLENKLDNISESLNEYENTEQKLGVIEEQLEQISFKINEYQVWQNKKDYQDVEEIYNRLPDMIMNEEKNYFPNLQTDSKEVELFYKMRFYNNEYYYCNIVEALELYGVDFDSMSITELDFLIWDIELLMAYYAMHEEAEGLETYTIYEQVTYKFDDYKVDMAEYSDTLDYGGWKQSYEEMSGAVISDNLEEIMMKIYKRINLNFNFNITIE